LTLPFTLTVFIATLFCIIRKPRRWHEAAFAAPAAALLLAFGVIDLGDASYIWSLVWNATLSLIGIMALTALLDDIGFFRWAALHVVRRYHRHPLRLLAGFAILSCLITTFFNNDGTVLIMTPIVLEATALLGMGTKARIAFLLGVGFMADTASATLLVSNLTNILTSDYFGISFGDYARHMLFPGLAASAATVAVLLIAMRRTIARDAAFAPSDREYPEPGTAIRDRSLFGWSWLALALILAGYLLSERLGLPVSFIACGGALALWLAALLRRSVDTGRLVRRTPWLIVVFALAMNLVVYALHVQGATDWFPALLEPIAQGGTASAVFGSGLLFSLLAAASNNLPAVLVSSLSISQTGDPGVLPFASLIGLSVGAKLTPIGSLATLLWLGLLRRDGVELSWGQYLKYGLALTLPVLLVSLGALWLQTALGG